MEPSIDKISLDFFVEVINKLYTNGISTIFCTPTAAAPIWVTHKHPERLYVDTNGVRMIHGSRQHCCTNNSFFRERVRIIVKAIAEEIGNLDGLIGWQTDNEFKCHVAECMCETCKVEWHLWLEKKYGSISVLNNAWGTEVFSQKYETFEQVPQPFPTPFMHNASLSTAYRMFSREKIVEFQDEQINIIRKYSASPITHNACRWFKVDNEELFKNLDFASFDNYPDSKNYEQMILDYDLWRNVKKDKPFWVMETSPSHNGSLRHYHSPHSNGYLVVEAVAAYALGAEGFSFWLWKQQRTGSELPHGSILSAWGKPTVGYENVLKANEARKLLEKILFNTQICQAEVAITYSDKARAYFFTEQLENLDYKSLMDDWYKRILNLGVNRDLVFEGAELDGYKILFTPFMPYVSHEYLERATEFVENGGTWIIGPLTGGRTGEHTNHTNAALGSIESVAGVETVFSCPLSGTDTFGSAFGITSELQLWSNIFKTNGAKEMGTIFSGLTPGLSFITENIVGTGKIVLLGSMPQGENGDLMLRVMITHYVKECGIKMCSDVSEGTIIVPREGDGFKVWIIINMDGKGGCVTLPATCIDEITGEELRCCILEIGCFEYRVVRF